MIRAILFDLDGVLVDACEWHYEALNLALAEHGYAINRHEHLAVYNGLPTRVKLDLLTEREGLPREWHPIIAARKQELTRDVIRQRCVPEARMVRLLNDLSTRGYMLAVCSNAVRETVDLMLDCAALRGFFKVTLSNQDVAQPKPSPAIYLRAMFKLRVRPDECLIVEDSPLGIEAGRKSGGHVVPVSSSRDVTIELIDIAIKRIDAEHRAAGGRSRLPVQGTLSPA